LRAITNKPGSFFRQTYRHGFPSPPEDRFRRA
jgi:hypothetical protein